MNILDSKLALYIVKRLLLALFTVFLVITITFFAMKAIPGGPFLSEKAATPAVTAALEAKYGLDKPTVSYTVTTSAGKTYSLSFGLKLTTTESAYYALYNDDNKRSFEKI